MNRKTLIVVATLILVIAGGLLYVLMSGKDNKVMMQESGVVDQTVKETPAEPSSREAVAGKYVDYTEEVFQATEGTRLIFFYAPWCPQCRALDASIKSSSLPDDTTIFKLDYDSNQALRQKYGVTLQTTVVKVNEKGDKVASYIAYAEHNYEAVRKALLP